MRLCRWPALVALAHDRYVEHPTALRKDVT